MYLGHQMQNLFGSEFWSLSSSVFPVDCYKQKLYFGRALNITNKL